MPCLSTIREEEGINLLEEPFGKSQQSAQAIWDLSLTQTNGWRSPPTVTESGVTVCWVTCLFAGREVGSTDSEWRQCRGNHWRYSWAQHVGQNHAVLRCVSKYNSHLWNRSGEIKWVQAGNKVQIYLEDINGREELLQGIWSPLSLF